MGRGCHGLYTTVMLCKCSTDCSDPVNTNYSTLLMITWNRDIDSMYIQLYICYYLMCIYIIYICI